MTQEEYNNIDWQRGNVVRLTNGKEYPVKKPKKKYILLYSAEHESYFVANSDIIDCRTSDKLEYFCLPIAEMDYYDTIPRLLSSVISTL